MKNILFGLLMLNATSGLAQTNTVVRPKLVVGIVIDQMRWDYLYRYYDSYGAGGFKRLLRSGFNCQNTFINYLPSYTAPGHATIYSGAVPAIHGIVGNDWIDPASSACIYCAQDAATHTVGGSAASGSMSPRNMKATTVGDELRLAGNFRPKVFGVALKDRGAIFPAGHSANGAYWFDDSTGNFVSSTYYGQQLPAWLQRFNARRWADTFLAEDWQTRYPLSFYHQSTADDNAYEELKKEESAPVFPHRMKAGKYKMLRGTPRGNTLTFLTAMALMKGEKLGGGTETDMLTISLSSTDYIGHAYGPNAVETEDTYLRLDEDIASFLRYLDHTVGSGNYLLFLSADHGAAHNTTFLSDHNIPSGVLSEYDMKRDLNARLKRELGQDSMVQAVMNYQVFLNELLIERKRLNRTRVKELIIRYCHAYEGMARVVDMEAGISLPEPLASQMQNGYYPKRCGAIALLYEPGWYSGGPKGTTHGTWNPYDTHIPLLWYGWHIPAGTSYKQVAVTDIAATLSALLHIQMPNGCVGKVIEFDR